MYKIIYENTIINYTIIKKTKKKNVSLYVKYPNIVQIVSPMSYSDDVLHNLVKSKSKWIFTKIKDFENQTDNHNKISIDNKSKISYFGNEFEVVILEKKNVKDFSLQVYDNKFVFDVPLQSIDSNIKHILSELLISYFIKQGSLDISKRIHFYTKKLGVEPNTIKVNNKKTSWGSCSSLGNININYKLLLAPIDIIDYVLVHELCHLKEMNHSKSFWKLVESIIPDYLEKRNWLKTNGFNLSL